MWPVGVPCHIQLLLHLRNKWWKMVFVQQPRTEKQIGNVVSAPDAFARTI